MKEIITSREDIFLAKIAGKDVDIKTMTPPVATNMTEKLMLDIADRIDNIEAGGGGGDKYETVAEIEVGTMEQHADIPFDLYGCPISDAMTITDGETYYFNDTEHPSTEIDEIDTSKIVFWNARLVDDTLIKVEEGQPIYGVVNVDGAGVIISDTPDISDSTVTILKKVSGGSTITVDDELSGTSENPVQNKVITAALANSGAKTIHVTVAVPEQEGDAPSFTIEETNEECYAMVTSGEPVFLEVTVPGAVKLYGFMISCTAQSENSWFATFLINKTYTATSISVATATFSNPVDGKRVDFEDITYNFGD